MRGILLPFFSAAKPWQNIFLPLFYSSYSFCPPLFRATLLLFLPHLTPLHPHYPHFFIIPPNHPLVLSYHFFHPAILLLSILFFLSPTSCPPLLRAILVAINLFATHTAIIPTSPLFQPQSLHPHPSNPFALFSMTKEI